MAVVFLESKRGFKTKKEAEKDLIVSGFTRETKTDYFYKGSLSAKVRKSINNMTLRIDFYQVAF